MFEFFGPAIENFVTSPFVTVTSFFVTVTSFFVTVTSLFVTVTSYCWQVLSSSYWWISGLVIRSLHSKGSKKILIGTVDSHIVEFIVNAENDEKSFAVLMEGHSEGELWALAVHGNVFATGSDDRTVRWVPSVDSNFCGCY